MSDNEIVDRPRGASPESPATEPADRTLLSARITWVQLLALIGGAWAITAVLVGVVYTGIKDEIGDVKAEVLATRKDDIGEVKADLRAIRGDIQTSLLSVPGTSPRELK